MLVRTLFGNKPGPTVTIIAGVHGNETCGLTAINAIEKIDCGTLHLITANEEAIRERKRFIQTDLNRSFLFPDSAEGKIAKEIAQYLDKSDALLDIHASTTSTSEPFCICEEQSFDIAKKLPGEYIVTNISSIHEGSTDGYMNRQGKIAICIECGYLENVSTKEVALKSALIFLHEFGMLNYDSTAQDKKILRVYEHHINESEYRLTKQFTDFEQIKKDTIIGSEGVKKLLVQKDSYILFAKQYMLKPGICFVLLEKF